jgi:hypothetical protein
MKRQFTTLLLIALLVAGCGGGDDYLDQGVVTSLPSGDALGSDRSGEYELELYTTSCAGTCVIDYGVLTVTFCEVGDIDNETVTVTQQDGHLQVDSGGSLFVTRMTGGIWSDGSFDVGGYSTEEGGQVHITGRAEGSLTSGGDLTGVARAHGWGTVDGQSLNCAASYDVTGSRL